MKTLAIIKERLNRWILGTQVFGLEVQLVSKNEARFHLTHLQRKGASVDILEVSQPASMEEVIERIGGRPVQVCITGRGVVTRRVGSNSEDPDLSALFPSVNLSEVEYRIYRNPSNNWVALVRSSLLDQWLRAMREAHCHITHIDVSGVSVLSNVSLFENHPERLEAHAFEWHDRELHQYTFDPQPESDDRDRFYDHPLRYALSMLSGIRFFGYQAFAVLNDRQGSLFDFVIMRTRKAFVIGYGACLFVALMGSLVLMQTSRQQAVELERQTAGLRQKVNQVKTQDEALVADASLYASIREERSERYAELLEDIARAIPENTRLSELVLHPAIRKKKRQGDPVQFEKSSVLVSGRISRLSSFSGLVEQLDALPWVIDVKILSLVYDEDDGVHLFQLSLQL